MKKSILSLLALLGVVQVIWASNPYMRNHQVSDYLTDRFLSTGILDWLASKQKSTSDIADAWEDLVDDHGYGDVLQKDGAGYLKKIMKTEGYDYFSSLAGTANLSNANTIVDPLRPKKRGVMEDLHYALSYNDLTKGWNPEHPLYLYHSNKDDVVPVSNRTVAKNLFGNWVEQLDPAINLGHVETAIEFLTGTEKRNAVNKLANASVHPSKSYTGNGERIYKGTVKVDGNDVTAEYVVRHNDEDGRDYAILGSGYNACISQYQMGKVEVPAQVSLADNTYPVGGVNDMAFRLCLGITEVKLPEGVKRIGDFAFYGCRELTDVDMPSSPFPKWTVSCGCTLTSVLMASTSAVVSVSFWNLMQ